MNECFEVGFVTMSSTAGHRGALHDEQSSSASEQPLNLPPPGLQSSDERQTVRHVLLCLLLNVCLLAVS